ncbi:aldehyde dehydrogenase [candidate division KSB1 bacterium]|nr:aldehyde dehydrogenase [candidate division KSB1 bacterium]NIR69157.1 aldehyde dehydrogenase [candidate division KSB1 bacterium]NIS25668.1 aldehyde dehydrogenase [candidate division KSB1 bacterium]NIT72536.1 aldehyde dehydrogenase [candidate division KSB1 bacterium]NIU26345.1 aldehyde dehydrogenase [candidate division KSB1 bacterium]
MHIPILRAGQPYKSLDVLQVKNFITGETVAELSQANSGLIRKDFARAEENKHTLDSLPGQELLMMCKNAADLFMRENLPLDGETQSPEDYIKILSTTSGMPEVLCSKNMEKIRLVLDEMETVLGGLTRGLGLEILDVGWGKQNERLLSYICQTNALGAILPNNSPGVHSLWLPCIPLKVPLVLKPGTQEPWTPYRVIQAFIAAGCPREAFSYYPTDYSGATEILLRSGRSMFFGDVSTVKPWQNDHRVQIHGPGWSKVLIGEDQIANWQQYAEPIVDSILINSGRSCLNASGVWVPAHGRDIAEALAKRLAQIEAKPMDDPEAQLAAFVNPTVAERISNLIDAGLSQDGAEDITAKYRDGKRLVEKDGCTFLLPTVVWCDSPEHPLANTELLFPFASVVEVPQNEILEKMGQTLVLTAITEDRQFIQKILAATNVDRLNLGAIPTSKISWDQPHEGNLFEHLYRQRAFQLSIE